MPSSRPYDNRLRQEQAQATADRIMAALCELLIDERPASVSIPDVAKRAGVSVRTVYSHFPTKDDLFEGLGPYVSRTYFEAYQTPDFDPNGPIAEMARLAGPAFASVIPLFVALARAGIDDDEHAQQRSDERLAHMANLIEHDAPKLDAGSTKRLASLFGAIVSWPVVQRLQRAGEDPDGSGELLAWVSDALIAHANSVGLPGAEPPKPKAATKRAPRPASKTARAATSTPTTTKTTARRSTAKPTS